MSKDYNQLYYALNTQLKSRNDLVKEIEWRVREITTIDNNIIKKIKSIKYNISYDDIQRSMLLYNSGKEFNYHNDKCYIFIKDTFFSKKDDPKISHVYKIGTERFVFIISLSDVRFSIVIPICSEITEDNLERCAYGKIRLHKKNDYSGESELLCEDYDPNNIKTAIKKLIKNSNKKLIPKKSINEFRKQIDNLKMSDVEAEKILQQCYGDVTLAANIYNRINKKK